MKLKPTPYLFVLFVLFDIIYITLSEGQTKGQLVGSDWVANSSERAEKWSQCW